MNIIKGNGLRLLEETVSVWLKKRSSVEMAVKLEKKGGRIYGRKVKL